MRMSPISISSSFIACSSPEAATLFGQVAVMFCSIKLIRHESSPKEKTVPDGLLYVGYRTRKVRRTSFCS